MGYKSSLGAAPAAEETATTETDPCAACTKKYKNHCNKSPWWHSKDDHRCACGANLKWGYSATVPKQIATAVPTVRVTYSLHVHQIQRGLRLQSFHLQAEQSKYRAACSKSSHRASPAPWAAEKGSLWGPPLLK